jgi:putative IMPACT (imprinted ancient) family translation regulator
MPVLDIIRKNGCTDTVIVVVRYFGGILLGTGGLVHAYTEAALGALKTAKIITYNTYATATVKLSYSDYQKALPIFSDFDFRSDQTEYLEDVTTTGVLLAENYISFEEKLTEITSGRAKTEKIDEKFDFRE